jgi:hypothetical protein
LATAVWKYWLQPLITGFMALIRATMGEPTCVRQRALSLRFTAVIASGLGLISSLYPLRELLGGIVSDVEP